MSDFKLSNLFTIKHYVEGVSHVIYVGDIHFDCVTPSSRIDDFPTTMLDKFLNMMIQFNTKYGNDFIVVILGDVFHRNSQSVYYLNQVLSVMRQANDYCKGIFTIFGNHDLAFERIDSSLKSPLRTLLESGFVKLFGCISLKSSRYSYLNIVGYQYPEVCQDRLGVITSFGIPDVGDFHLVAHRFFETQDPMNISNEFIANSGYNMVILGHDHIQYPSKLCGSSLVVRPGSFSRGTAHYMNLVRGIDVADYSLDERTVEYVPVACKESKYVFSTSAFHKEGKPDVIISKVNEHMLSLVNSLERSDSKSKVYDVLDKFEVSQDVKKVIEVYLVNEGIYRTSQSKLN